MWDNIIKGLSPADVFIEYQASIKCSILSKENVEPIEGTECALLSYCTNYNENFEGFDFVKHENLLVHTLVAEKVIVCYNEPCLYMQILSYDYKLETAWNAQLFCLFLTTWMLLQHSELYILSRKSFRVVCSYVCRRVVQS